MIDSVEIAVAAGDGGDGIVSFRHKKFVPRGGPDGGDGGNGGDIVLIADRQVSTLSRFHDRRLQEAESGQRGEPFRRTGKSGQLLEIRLPPGCEVLDVTNGSAAELVADLTEDGARVVIVRGGRGGRGNRRFATSTRQAPKFAQHGVLGERRRLRIELKLLADIGLIGLPNTGKSTLLRAWSAATPKVASYPFTTLEPELGVVRVDYDSFVAADMPGLIEGASRGVGLGHEFLQHIERTRVLVHVIDMTSEDPVADRALINAELEAFGHGLAEKPQIIALNKLDDADAGARLELLEESGALDALGEPRMVISALTRDGTDGLARRALQTLRDAIEEEGRSASSPVLRPEPRRRRFTIEHVDGVAVVEGRSAVRWAETLDLENNEARYELFDRLRRMGVKRALERSGVKPGDPVRIGAAELRWEG
jgi:GTP-binding protein